MTISLYLTLTITKSSCLAISPSLTTEKSLNRSYVGRLRFLASSPFALVRYSYLSLTNAMSLNRVMINLANSYYLLSMSLSNAKNMHPRLFRTTRKMFSFFRKLSFSLLQVDLATIVSSLLFLLYGASSLPNLPAILTAILRILQICRVFVTLSTGHHFVTL